MHKDSIGGVSKEQQDEILSRAKEVETRCGRVPIGTMSVEDRKAIIRAAIIGMGKGFKKAGHEVLKLNVQLENMKE